MKLLLLLLFLFSYLFVPTTKPFRLLLDSDIQAATPPRGWNSYDSFSWTINEQDFIDNAQLVSQKLKSFGYEYVVVDYLWYRKMVPGANADSLGFDVIDEWGRMLPDPQRWPSSVGGKGFFQVAQKVHDMGLKFGIHVMRGISTQAVNANTPILDITTGGPFQQGGRNWTAEDIGITDRLCPWMPHGFMSVNTSVDAGKAFLNSLYQQYSEWGVDFVKLDCVFGEDLDLDEIRIVSQAIASQNSTVLFSLSPGKQATPEMASSTNVSGIANMYRVTGDDWDTWVDVASHFDVARDFAAAGLIGAPGLKGRSWPDLDMLPLGWITDPASNEGPHRSCGLTPDEQKTQVTLWSIAKSPLVFGGDMRKLDNYTYQLLTEPTLLQINSDSSNNKEFAKIVGNQTARKEQNWLVSLWRSIYAILTPFVVSGSSNYTPTGVRSWVATGNQGETYVGFFNLNDGATVISAKLADLDVALPGRNITGVCNGKEIWSGNELGVVQQSFQVNVSSHGVALIKRSHIQVLICCSNSSILYQLQEMCFP